MPLQRRLVPFSDPDWLFELKYDGFRAICCVERGVTRLISRRGNTYKGFRVLCDAIARELKSEDALLDGEIVCLDASGHASTSGAVSHVLRLFFGSDELTFQMTTTNPNALQNTRTFTRLSQAEDEVINARVYVGIHYRNSDTTARAQGLRVANWVFKNYFRPVGDPRFGAQHK